MRFAHLIGRCCLAAACLTGTSSVLAAAATADTGDADPGLDLASVHCVTTVPPMFTVDLAPHVLGDTANVTLDSPGQAHLQGHYLISRLTEKQGGVLMRGLTYYSVAPNQQVVISATLHNDDASRPGPGSLYYNGLNLTMSCTGSEQ